MQGGRLQTGNGNTSDRGEIPQQIPTSILMFGCDQLLSVLRMRNIVANGVDIYAKIIYSVNVTRYSEKSTTVAVKIPPRGVVIERRQCRQRGP